MENTRYLSFLIICFWNIDSISFNGKSAYTEKNNIYENLHIPPPGPFLGYKYIQITAKTLDLDKKAQIYNLCLQKRSYSSIYIYWNITSKSIVWNTTM